MTKHDQDALSAMQNVADPLAFMQAVNHLIRGRIKQCGKCGLCSSCDVAIHLGLVKDPLEKEAQALSEASNG